MAPAKQQTLINRGEQQVREYQITSQPISADGKASLCRVTEIAGFHTRTLLMIEGPCAALHTGC